MDWPPGLEAWEASLAMDRAGFRDWVRESSCAGFSALGHWTDLPRPVYDFMEGSLVHWRQHQC